MFVTVCFPREYTLVTVAEMGMVPECDSGKWRFDPAQSPHLTNKETYVPR